MLMVFCKLHRWSSLSKELLPPFLLPSHPQECSGFEKKNHTHAQTDTHTHRHRHTHEKRFTVCGQWTQQWHSFLINRLHFALNPNQYAVNNGIKHRCIAREIMITAGLRRCGGEGASAGLLRLSCESCLRSLPHFTCCWFAVACVVASLWSPMLTWKSWHFSKGMQGSALPLFFWLLLVRSAPSGKVTYTLLKLQR